MRLYIGIDVGTTNIKAMVFCPETLERLGFASTPTPCGSDGLYALDALFNAAMDTLSRVIDGLPASDICAIGVSSMGESGALLDANGNILTPVIPWYDTRSQPHADRLSEALGGEAIYRVTGQLCSGKFGVTKLMWQKDNCPNSFASARYWLGVNDYILYRLSGRRVCDYSIAARSMAFDIHRLAWSEPILRAAGVDEGFMSECVPGGSPIGTLLPDIAQNIGLSSKTLIVTGGHDHACAAVGGGCIRPGTLLDSMGTSEVAIFPISEAPVTHEMYRAQVTIYPHCSDTLYRALTSMQACGASLDWFLNIWSEYLPKHARKARAELYAFMESSASACQESAELMYFPFLRGVLGSPEAGGAFMGIRDDHGFPDFAKALYDGLCCEFVWQLRQNADALNASFHRLCVVGGPSKSAYFMQRKADFSGMTLSVPAMQEAACLGSALLAAVGSGDIDFSAISEIVAALPCERYMPEHSSVMARKLRRYGVRREHIIACYKEENEHDQNRSAL